MIIAVLFVAFVIYLGKTRSEASQASLTAQIFAQTSEAAAPAPSGTAANADGNSPDGAIPVMHFAVDTGPFPNSTQAQGVAKWGWDYFRAQPMVIPVRGQGRTVYRVRLLVETREKADTLANAIFHDNNLQAHVLAIR